MVGKKRTQGVRRQYGGRGGARSKVGARGQTANDCRSNFLPGWAILEFSDCVEESRGDRSAGRPEPIYTGDGVREIASQGVGATRTGEALRGATRQSALFVLAG